MNFGVDVGESLVNTRGGAAAGEDSGDGPNVPTDTALNVPAFPPLRVLVLLPREAKNPVGLVFAGEIGARPRLLPIDDTGARTEPLDLCWAREG